MTRALSLCHVVSAHSIVLTSFCSCFLSTVPENTIKALSGAFFMYRWQTFRRYRFALLALLLSLFVFITLSSSSLNLSAQGGAWAGQYWNNRNLSGTPALTRQDASINFDWGNGSPAAKSFPIISLPNGLKLPTCRPELIVLRPPLMTACASGSIMS